LMSRVRAIRPTRCGGYILKTAPNASEIWPETAAKSARKIEYSSRMQLALLGVRERDQPPFGRDRDPSLDQGCVPPAQQDGLTARQPRRIGRADIERRESLQAGLDAEKKRRKRNFRHCGGLAIAGEFIDPDRIGLAERADHR